MKRGIGEDWLAVEWPILTTDRPKGVAARQARAATTIQQRCTHACRGTVRAHKKGPGKQPGLEVV